MKETIFSLIFILLCLNVLAQNEVEVYLDADFEQVENKNDAVIIRKARITDNHFIIEDQFINGMMLNYGEYISIDPFIEDGLSTHYDYGTVYSTGNYKSGMLTGKWLYAHPEGFDTVDYSPVEKYLAGFVDCNDRYPKADEKIREEVLQFIKEHIHMPARARNDSNYMNCVFSFVLDTNGAIRCPKIANVQNNDIAYELLRVALLFQGKYTKPVSISISDPFQDEEPGFVFVDEVATFKGESFEAFRSWVQENLVYPEGFQNNGIKSITVQFSVTSRGYVTDVKVLRGIDPILDYEACRVLKSSPKWKAANFRGRPVRQQFVMPIYFHKDMEPDK